MPSEEPVGYIRYHRIRPEYLTITTREPGHDPHPNSVQGEVGEVIYVGSALIYFVKIGEGREIEVRAPRSEAALAIQKGTHVSVSWRPEHTVVVPDDELETRGAEADLDLSTQQLLRP